MNKVLRGIIKPNRTDKDHSMIFQQITNNSRAQWILEVSKGDHDLYCFRSFP